MEEIVTKNPWWSLSKFTQARIALGRAGTSLPTRQHLEFQLSHARARSAVHHTLNYIDIQNKLHDRGWDVLDLASAAETRSIYLQRPDLGRVLAEKSEEKLKASRSETCDFDISIVIVDGLSSFAIERNAIPLFDQLAPQLLTRGFKLSPLALVRQGRVAIGDKICIRLQAKCVVVLIGERPGLSSPDSLGVYMTWMPTDRTTDANRNCISNIRSGGVNFQDAVNKLLYLIEQAFVRRISGVYLKDETVVPELVDSSKNANLLLER